MSNLGDTTTFKSFVEREAAAEKAAADGGGVAGAPPTTSSTADEKGPVSKKKKTLTRSITMDRLSTYVNVLKREKAANGAVPTVEVKCDFSYTLRLPKKTVERKIVTVPEAFAAVAMAPFKAIAAKAGARLAKMNDDDDDDDDDDAVQEFRVLRRVECAFKPGTLTLVLAPPGHGKTSLLKAVANALPDGAVDGAITYSGLTAAELSERAVDANRLATYVEQLDTHLPFLNVRETTKFSHDNATPPPTDAQLFDDKLEAVTNLLALESCLDTIIGDDLVRGVSGGEKKRVTVAEALVTNARVLCMDEISTGLDAAVTYNIVAALRAWARTTGGAAVVALLQPTPEVFDQFDDLLLLREGAVVYHGDKNAATKYFAGMGFHKGGAEEDVADWFVNLVADPSKTLTRGSKADVKALASAPTTTDALESAWRASKSPMREASIATTATPADVALTSDFARAQYGASYPRSRMTHFKSVLARQATVTARNKLFVMTRLFSALVTSVVLGSVWFDLDKEKGFEKLGMLLFCVLHISFSNFSELTFSVEQKYVAYKHLDGKLFPPTSYIVAWAMVHLPIAIVETAVFALVMYPMVGLVWAFKNWLFFYFNLVLANVAMASFFRIIALLAPNMEAAQTFPGPVIAVFIIFAGFLITPSKMGWLKFMYYVSLFAYSLRSLCQNEFLSDSYQDTKVASNAMEYATYIAANPAEKNTAVATLCDSGAFTCTTMGTAIMDTISIEDDSSWFWGGALFCLGFFCVTFYGAVRALKKVRITRNVGSSRTGTADDEENDAAREKKPKPTDAAVVAAAASAVVDDVAVNVNVEQSSVEFVPMSIAWRDLEYTVDVAKQAGGGTKKLLQSVTSAARPGRVLALMGASGAGKTTLLDVIAGRKTGGHRRGTITLNGNEVEKQTFARLTAYCEQNDLHNEFATVGEALEFSATLRLDDAVTAAQRRGFVSEALDILELRPLRDRMIGKSGDANGLSPGQRKILTVAVELVSNAPVFFLDEPTSGLDSRAALIVMSEVNKVAKMGRTVISTIHQPSREIFLMFDDMLLLQRGGWQVYFGPLGPSNASTFVSYMESLASTGYKKLPKGMNPASWMLDVLGGTDSSAAAGEESKETGEVQDGKTLEDAFKASKAGAAASAVVAELSRAEDGVEMFSFASEYARTMPVQLATILARSHKAQLRDVAYNCGRIGVLFVLYILFGTIYYDLDTSDEGGVQSMVAVVFMSTIFTGIICMNSVMPVRVRERSVSYRERSSHMYDGVPYSLAHALIEIPWIVTISFVSVTPLYWMVGMVDSAGSFFFHVLVNVLVAYCFLSFGQFIACVCKTIQTAQAGASAIIPIMFLFGGLYLPYPQIPVYWQWAYYLNPVSFAIMSVVAPQFERRRCTGAYPAGDCPNIAAFRGAYYEQIDTLAYVEDKYDIDYDDRWMGALYLFIFAACCQTLHVLAGKFITNVNR